jgi:hypothetical protein
MLMNASNKALENAEEVHIERLNHWSRTFGHVSNSQLSSSWHFIYHRLVVDGTPASSIVQNQECIVRHFRCYIVKSTAALTLAISTNAPPENRTMSCIAGLSDALDKQTSSKKDVCSYLTLLPSSANSHSS